MARAQGTAYALPVLTTVDGPTSVSGAPGGGVLDRSVEAVTDLVDAAAGLLTVRNAGVVLGVMVLVLLGWRLLQTLLTRRALRPERRMRLLALPTETFDPTSEEVDRFAAQLSRVRRSVRGGLDRPAQAVRLRLDSIGAGQCAYRIEGPDRAASILQLAGYAEVELRPADAVDVDALTSPEPAPLQPGRAGPSAGPPLEPDGGAS
jgi:hypothetical protein